MPITVYSRPSCVQCNATKRWIKNHGGSYEEKNVDADPEALQHVLDAGVQQLPFVETDEDSWAGYQPDKLKAVITQE